MPRAGRTLFAVLLCLLGRSLWGQEARELVILADSQEKVGDTYVLRGQVEIRYRGMTLKAGQITYQESSGDATAEGQVEFERDDEVVRAESATYNLRSGQGRFLRVRATVDIRARPDPDLLVSPNPFYFEAEAVDRRADGSYVAHHGWVTNCTPESAKWKLRAARAVILPGERVTLFGSSFHLGPLPLLYLPFVTHPIQQRPRQSGFLLPSVGNNSRKGTTLGEGFFWAITDHADLRLSAEIFQARGWSRRAEFRLLPTARSSVYVSYFGVTDWGFARRAGQIDQSGDFIHVFTDGEISPGWRGVVDFNHLSSLRFRLGFSETFNEAIISEVHANAFLSHNRDTFYFNGFFRRYRNFEIRQPLSPLVPLEETAVTLVAAPGLEFGTRPRRVDSLGVPLYLRLDASAVGLRRRERRFETPSLVQRLDVYPRVTLPLLRSRYLQLIPTLGVRATRYGARLVDDPSQPGGKRVLSQPLRRLTEEVQVDLRLPTVGRIYERPQHRFKHSIEPQAVYHYVNGVDAFGETLLFDETDILTDTHEIEYSLTQRLFRKERQPPPGEGTAVQEVISWRLAQKYFFDPDLRGALVGGQRNVAATLASLTGYAWALEPRRFSPLISTLKITPGRKYDTEWRLDYDTRRNKTLNSRLTVSALLWREFRASLAHFVTRNDPLLQPRSHQLRFLVSYGQLNRRGLNATFGATWNIRQDFFQNTVAQVSYNWDCCGLAFEFRRLGLGQLRSENQFRVAFTVANLGTFGTIRKQEQLF
ncbi:MAG: LPS-assembly protein LptD [Acidobacteria bacterium]|nr:LPS-assembly protein LptD [Acidobacteriota bacterium]